MILTLNTLDSLVRELRSELNLDITFNEPDTGRSIEFEASKQLTECMAQFAHHRISFKKLESMSRSEVKEVLTKTFKRL